MKHLYDHAAIQCSRIITAIYSTSFSIGVRCLHSDLRDPIHSIYGFVRLADEIVDSFHGYDKRELLQKFRVDTYQAIEQRISLNPILNSFQFTVNKFGIEHEVIEQFLNSMLMDLERKEYDSAGLKEYIIGSAEVVGLMCLRVFCQNDIQLYQKLTPHAMSLGSAFQKVNFLRDIKADFSGLGRSYFPGVDPDNFDDSDKRAIEKSIEEDFHHAYEGVQKLPHQARLGVYVAYIYFRALFAKIKATPAEEIMSRRVRIPNLQKVGLLVFSYLSFQFSRMLKPLGTMRIMRNVSWQQQHETQNSETA